MTDYASFEVDLDDLTLHEYGGLPPPTMEDKIIVGICAMPKKAKSKPMLEIIKRVVELGGFEIVFFQKEVLLEKPVEEWPLCHCMISFFSDGFPLEKAERYAELRKPFLVNQLTPQRLLMDRRHVMAILRKHGVPTPKQLVINRSSDSVSGYPVQQTTTEMEEYDDYIVIDGQRLDKPFVEKPVDGDDHNIYIYYPRSSGGGSCRLFRKVKNRCSEFFPDESRVRRDGSYIYEEFMPTEGSDIKVYTVTSDYAHSEARKAPSIDGVVSRNEAGYEIRYPVLLTEEEKMISDLVVHAFGQRICGFDILRTDKGSFVCDVNGWSFVKNNEKYYTDVSLILNDLMKRAMGVWRPDTNQPHLASLVDEESEAETDENVVHEELRAIISVIRHGDRTPKQKLKIDVEHKAVLALFDKYGDGLPREELKLKSAAQLGDVLRIINFLTAEASKYCNDEDSECEFDNLDKLEQAKSVLEMHGTFKGINRKVQLKPTRWNSSGAITRAQFILKWGGVLTNLGREEAEKMGQIFRQKMYPYDGLLRLHSTYRHDLKIYSSSEGRVQVTAAAFVKGLLQLDGHLTPILTSLVRKGKDTDEMLNEAGDSKDVADRVKKQLHAALLHREPEEDAARKARLLDVIATGRESSSIAHSLAKMNYDPNQCMQALHVHLVGLVKQLTIVRSRFRDKHGGQAIQSPLLPGDQTPVEETEDDNTEGGSAAASIAGTMSKDEGIALSMSWHRWVKLQRDFYNKKKDTYDLSKIPDIYDSAKFDVLHHPHFLDLRPLHLVHIFQLSKLLADVIVPQEYGITFEDKADIGARICHHMMDKIQNDIAMTIRHCTRDDIKIKSPSSEGDPLSRGLPPSAPSTSSLCTTGGDEATTPKTDATLHQLDKRFAKSLGIKSTDRMVRSRFYFTSESHLHSLLNVLRCNNSEDKAEAANMATLDNAANERVNKIEELNYLTHIVFQLFEIKSRKTSAQDDKGEFPSRFRVTVSLSGGTETFVSDDGKVKHGSREEAPIVKSFKRYFRLNTNDDTSWGPFANVQLDPCTKMVHLWQNIDVNLLNNLMTKVSADIKAELAIEHANPPTNAETADGEQS